jgi:hypothetical protein
VLVATESTKATISERESVITGGAQTFSVTVLLESRWEQVLLILHRYL